MGDLSARESRESAEEEKRRLINSYMQEKFTPEQLLADFKVESSNVIIKEGAVPCRYSYGKNAGKFSCPGTDQDCFGIEGEGTKIDHCELRKGFKRYGGKLGYYQHLIRGLEKKGVDVSELESIWQEVRDYLSAKDLERASAELTGLHGRIFFEKGKLEEKISKKQFLSS